MAAPFIADDQDVVDLRWPNFSQPLDLINHAKSVRVVPDAATVVASVEHDMMIEDLKRVLADLIEIAVTRRDLDASIAKVNALLRRYGA